jgi:NAD+ synthase (glutamine-hydrolysing)
VKTDGDFLRIALAQINPTVGDIAGNSDLLFHVSREAEKKNAHLVVFPELDLTGYPPEDLLLKPAFIRDNMRALTSLASRITTIAAIVGFVDFRNGHRFNAAAWIEKGKVRGVYHKIRLPNYGVFDEQRYFSSGSAPFTEMLRNTTVGLTICEDIWIVGPHLKALREKKPDLVINISASPFHVGKIVERRAAVRRSARFLNAPVAYCNMVGGQDELVFDGGSFVMDPKGRVRLQADPFKQGLTFFDITRRGRKMGLSSITPSAALLEPIEEVFQALTMGTRDYVEKNAFNKVAIGLSGGIDSALVAAVAVEALGKDQVVGVTMPSHFNSVETRNDAFQLAKNLGIQLLEIPIENLFKEYGKVLAPVFIGTRPNSAEENLQARIRGTLLMALSNKFGWLVLTTGNKSETSTGYCTLYGDTAGGFAVLKDLFKTTVYELARFINRRAGQDLIPQTIIERPPTAELRANQKDEDALGRYAELDPIILEYVQKNKSLSELTKQKPSKADYIRKIVSMIDRAEYKRRQAPPGIKITPRSFGRDHRMPITNRYQPQ